MTISSKLKNGILHPKEALLYILLDSKQYAVYKDQNSYPEFDVQPENIVEQHMVKTTDIRQHLMTLHMLTRELNLRTILELGTRTGESTVALLEAARNIDGRVYSVDIGICSEAKRIVKQCGLQNYWTFMQGDDLKIPWTEPIDHLFIDTSHKFDHTLKELEKYEPFVKNGGIISMHDIVSSPEVLKALKYYSRNRADLHLYRYFNNYGLAVIFKNAISK